MQENIRFIQAAPDSGIIANTATHHLNLETIKVEYGHNFNTLTIINNSTEELSVKLDGRKVGYINGNGGSFGIDWKDGIVFDDVQITNEDAAASTAANEIRVIVGRTGQGVL